jgi:DNA-binding CsgD family transcriptional regulator/PAS domain-containing protein
MTNRMPLEQYACLVDAIYAAALDPTEWLRVGRMMAEATDSLIGGIGIFDASSGQFVQIFMHGAPEGYWERYQQTIQINPLLPAGVLSKSGDILINSEVVSEDELIKSRFYTEFMQPLGLRDSMAMVCLRSGTRIAIAGVNRAVPSPLYNADDQQVLRLLAPHICRALTISDVFDLKTVKSDALEAALDNLSAGVFLLNEDGRIAHMNKAADAIVKMDSIVSIREWRLWPKNKSSRDALASALAPQAAGVEPAIALVPEDGEGRGMLATILPLARGSRPIAVSPMIPYWAVFIQDPQAPHMMPGEAFARLYGLTPAELRVALTLAPGLSPEQAGEMLGVALPTVRSHLQRIFAKTGTSRQADLVRLMMATMAPVARPLVE